jgi:beta-aspartyl-peptidase (threonine type)
MDGTTLRAGAVCALPPFKNPIVIARRVMEETRHVLLAGDGAVRFATARGLERADPASMITDYARQKLAAARAKLAVEGWAGGTVGAVARDASGRLAAATSTGGMVNKLVGRVGDSPIVGAGTYADDTAAACSTTGHGEAMIRVCLAKTVIDAARTASVESAVRDSLSMMRARTDGTGGAITVTRDGSIGLARTTRTMSWAAITNDGTRASGA